MTQEATMHIVKTSLGTCLYIQANEITPTQYNQLLALTQGNNPRIRDYIQRHDHETLEHIFYIPKQRPLRQLTTRTQTPNTLSQYMSHEAWIAYQDIERIFAKNYHIEIQEQQTPPPIQIGYKEENGRMYIRPYFKKKNDPFLTIRIPHIVRDLFNEHQLPLQIEKEPHHNAHITYIDINQESMDNWKHIQNNHANITFTPIDNW